MAANPAPNTTHDTIPGWLCDLSEFIRVLRSEGFKVGLDEDLKARALMGRLALEGIYLDSPQEAARWLGPVLCSTPKEQRLFPSRIQAWARTHGHGTSKQVKVDPPPTSAPSEGRPDGNLQTWWRLLLAIIVVVMIFLIARTLKGSAESLQPNPNLQLIDSSSSPQPSNFDGFWELAQMEVLAVLIFLLWVRWQAQRRGVLRRGAHRTIAQVEKLGVSPGKAYLYKGFTLRHPMQALRAHQLIASSRIDVRGTLRATIAAAGRVELQYARRPQLPDYLVLVESVSSNDHLAHLGDLVINRMRAEQIHLATYQYVEDPRTLRDSHNGVHSIADLAVRHGNFPLILVGDAQGLLDPLSGAPCTWVPELCTIFPSVILLTPVHTRRWSWREQRLTTAGLLVLPAMPEGFVMLGELLRGGLERSRIALLPSRFAMSLVARDGLRSPHWLFDTPPPEREAIIDSLLQDLPTPALELLAAAACFPQVRLDVTLYLGQELRRQDKTPLLDEQGLAALARLPWLRYGRIPDWLRLELISRLPANRKKQIRNALFDFVRKIEGPPTTGAWLELFYDEPRRLNYWLRCLARRPEGGAYRDAIFLSFMAANEEDPLAVEASESLRKLLKRNVAMLMLLWGSVASFAVVAGAAIDADARTRSLSFAVRFFPLAVLTLGTVLIWHARALIPKVSLWHLRVTDPALWAAAACVWALFCICPILPIGEATLTTAGLALLFAASQLSTDPPEATTVLWANIFTPSISWALWIAFALEFVEIDSILVTLTQLHEGIESVISRQLLVTLPAAAAVGRVLGSRLGLRLGDQARLFLSWITGHLLAVLALGAALQCWELLIAGQSPSTTFTVSATLQCGWLGSTYAVFIYLWRLGKIKQKHVMMWLGAGVLALLAASLPGISPFEEQLPKTSGLLVCIMLASLYHQSLVWRRLFTVLLTWYVVALLATTLLPASVTDAQGRLEAIQWLLAWPIFEWARRQTLAATVPTGENSETSRIPLWRRPIHSVLPEIRPYLLPVGLGLLAVGTLHPLLSRVTVTLGCAISVIGLLPSQLRLR